jgi:hypothetical protein
MRMLIALLLIWVALPWFAYTQMYKLTGSALFSIIFAGICIPIAIREVVRIDRSVSARNRRREEERNRCI